MICVQSLGALIPNDVRYYYHSFTFGLAGGEEICRQMPRIFSLEVQRYLRSVVLFTYLSDYDFFLGGWI
jgi:hypothetical protein